MERSIEALASICFFLLNLVMLGDPDSAAPPEMIKPQVRGTGASSHTLVSAPLCYAPDSGCRTTEKEFTLSNSLSALARGQWQTNIRLVWGRLWPPVADRSTRIG